MAKFAHFGKIILENLLKKLFGEICTFWQSIFRKMTLKFVWRNLHILAKVFQKNYSKIIWQNLPILAKVFLKSYSKKLFGEICTFWQKYSRKITPKLIWRKFAHFGKVLQKE